MVGYLEAVDKHSFGCACPRCVEDHNRRERLGVSIQAAIQTHENDGDWIGRHRASEAFIKLDNQLGVTF